MKKDLLIIIPVHKYDENVLLYLTKALNSVKEQTDSENITTIVVCPKEVAVEINKIKGFNFKVLVNTSDNFDYQSQVNFSLMMNSCTYFTILEYDDELSKNFVNNVNQYVESYSDVDIFLSLMIERNENSEGIKFTNETVWAQQFVGENGEIGFLNSDSLKQYTDFKLSGAVINRSKFLEIGGYKSNIKLTFMYELLLRALNSGIKIMCIPKINYSHLATREDSMFNIYAKEMSLPERKFWFETAAKEHNFPKDRVISVPSFKNKE